MENQWNYFRKKKSSFSLSSLLAVIAFVILAVILWLNIREPLDHIVRQKCFPLFYSSGFSLDSLLWILNQSCFLDSFSNLKPFKCLFWGYLQNDLHSDDLGTKSELNKKLATWLFKFWSKKYAQSATKKNANRSHFFPFNFIVKNRLLWFLFRRKVEWKKLNSCRIEDLCVFPRKMKPCRKTLTRLVSSRIGELCFWEVMIPFYWFWRSKTQDFFS